MYLYGRYSYRHRRPSPDQVRGCPSRSDPRCPPEKRPRSCGPCIRAADDGEPAQTICASRSLQAPDETLVVVDRVKIGLSLPVMTEEAAPKLARTRRKAKTRRSK